MIDNPQSPNEINSQFYEENPIPKSLLEKGKISAKNRLWIIGVLESHGVLLQGMPSKVRNCPEFVKVAVTNYPEALSYANKECRGTKDVVLSALKHATKAQDWISQLIDGELRKDMDIACAVIKMSPFAIKNLSPEINRMPSLLMEIIEAENNYGAINSYFRQIGMLTGSEERRNAFNSLKPLLKLKDQSFLIDQIRKLDDSALNPSSFENYCPHLLFELLTVESLELLKKELLNPPLLKHADEFIAYRKTINLQPNNKNKETVSNKKNRRVMS